MNIDLLGGLSYHCSIALVRPILTREWRSTVAHEQSIYSRPAFRNYCIYARRVVQSHFKHLRLQFPENRIFDECIDPELSRGAETWRAQLLCKSLSPGFRPLKKADDQNHAPLVPNTRTLAERGECVRNRRRWDANDEFIVEVVQERSKQDPANLETIFRLTCLERVPTLFRGGQASRWDPEQQNATRTTQEIEPFVPVRHGNQHQSSFTQPMSFCAKS